MRRVTYKPKLAAEILGRIANGEPLTKICGPNRLKRLPERRTVYEWLGRHDNFRKAYVLARRAQADLYADEIIEIADGRDEGALQPRQVERDRLRVATRRWLMTVLAPNLYSERLLLRSFSDDEALEHEEDDTALAARIAAIFASAQYQRQLDAD